MKTRRWILMEARVLVQLDVGTSHMQPSRWGGLDLGEYTGTPKKKSYAWQFLSDWNRKRPFWKSSSPQKLKMRTKRFQLFGSGFSVDYSIFFNFQDLDAVLIVFRCSISISIWFWLMRFLEHRLSSLYFGLNVTTDTKCLDLKNLRKLEHEHEPFLFWCCVPDFFWLINSWDPYIYIYCIIFTFIYSWILWVVSR